MQSFLSRWRTRRLAAAYAALAVLIAAIAAGSYAAHSVRGAERNPSAGATPLKTVNTPIRPNDFTRIAKEAGPAVVNINTETLPRQPENHPRRFHGHEMPMPRQKPGGSGGARKGPAPGQGQGQGEGSWQDFFNHFFGGQSPEGSDQDNQDNQGGPDGPSDQVQESLGSGFIVDPRGYIITNYHVIDKADKIYVKLSTDPENQDLGWPASVIGVDKATDLAVIKIDAHRPLPTVRMGNSDNVQVGDWVEAIGSPFALAQTVTAGIISARNRTIEPGASGQFQHFLQTDAAINPGNSGGPLLDMNGDVIGVNTAIYTQSVGYEGIGFAMPSNTVVAVYNDLIGPGHKVVRGSIGVEFRDGLSSAVDRMYGVKTGVLVMSVQPGGPAGKAGLKRLDIITSVNGRAIRNGDQLVDVIAGSRPGTTVTIGFLRNGKPESARVKIGDRDKVFASLDLAPAASAPPAAPGAGESQLGIVVEDTPPAVEAKIKIPGVVIDSVRPGSFADLEGLEPGLVITRLNRQPTGTRQQFDAVAGKLKSGDDVVFEIIDPRDPAQGINIVGGTLQ